MAALLAKPCFGGLRMDSLSGGEKPLPSLLLQVRAFIRPAKPRMSTWLSRASFAVRLVVATKGVLDCPVQRL